MKIYTFGVFLVLAFFWSSFLLWKLICLSSYKEGEAFDALFTFLGVGIFFGRLVYVIFHFSDFGFSFFKFILINGYPGLSIYGGLVGGFLSLFLFYLNKKIFFKQIIDYWISPLFLALAIGKLGSFFSNFDNLENLYQSLIFFLASFIAYRLFFEIRKDKFSVGFTFPFFIWLFSLESLIFSSRRGKNISFYLFLTFSFYFLYYFRSLILKFFKNIKNKMFLYGQKNYKRISSGFKGKLRKRDKKTEKTN